MSFRSLFCLFYTGFTVVPKSYKLALIQALLMAFVFLSGPFGICIFECTFYTGFTVVPKSYKLAHNTSSLDGTFISLDFTLVFFVQNTSSYFLCSACHGSLHTEVTLPLMQYRVGNHMVYVMIYCTYNCFFTISRLFILF